ncbi:fumarylacetoacetate hydrolase family protein [Aeromicrobium sp. CTD01-1L150]|uniref:fumarylacetoacetate hydrolase family protein n=1 Tax=Aeromicrobium sp. CTD01-1L150 TaxID=3341830 RepID=UPI0035C26F2F
MRTWLDVADDDPFGPQALPYGSFVHGRAGPRVGVRIGSQVLDLSGLTETHAGLGHLFERGTLDDLLDADATTWRAVRSFVHDQVTDPTRRVEVVPHLVPLEEVSLRLPFTVADYVDFYSSEHHASRVGEIFRPDAPRLPRPWRHLPIGYHGRAGTVVVSGTDVVRPRGQRLTADAEVVVGPTRKLDLEAEVAFVLGGSTTPGTSVDLDSARSHVFGVCLLNDWSARDVQSWEYVPLGPFLGKSFATSISAWVLPLEALETARVPPPPRETALVDHLDDTGSGAEPWGLDLRLEVRINGEVIARPPFASTYWTAAQQLVHLTSNGATIRPGDVFASGTVSGPADDERGCLLELTWDGTAPISLSDGTTRGYLADGDVVTITATAPGPRGSTVGLGEVSATVLPARAPE